MKAKRVAPNWGKGRLTKLQSQNVTIDRAYDQRGNIKSDKRTIATKIHTTTYEYDLADRIFKVNYPSGRIVTYNRDTMGRINQVTTKKTSVDASVTLANTIVYRPLSRNLESFTYGNGLTEANTWTQDYELGRCQLFDGATTLVDRSLVRADALNLTGITDNVTAANSQTFGYSAANRLNAASGPYGAYSWSYDLVGNRTVEAVTPSGGSLTTDTYAYPTTSNRIQTVTRGAATVRQMTGACPGEGRGRAGNLLTDNRAGTTTTYTYNKRNRLAPAWARRLSFVEPAAAPLKRPPRARWCGATPTAGWSSSPSAH